jgi:hypothetical protein
MRSDDPGDILDTVRLCYSSIERPLTALEYLDQPAKFFDALQFLSPFFANYREVMTRTPKTTNGSHET